MHNAQINCPYLVYREGMRGIKKLYVYKVKEGLVPNISKTHGLKFINTGRHGCRCIVPDYQIRGKAIRARENSFAFTACNLWNMLPKSIRDIRGEDLPHFKGKLDRVLSYYPDGPRCGTQGHSYNKYFHKSNSLTFNVHDRHGCKWDMPTSPLEEE